MVPQWAIANAGAAAVVIGDVLVADVVAIVIAAGAGAGAGAVVAVAVALPTLHTETHRTCYQSGEDTYHTRGKRDNQDAVQRR